jgi:hypothetical protein
MVGFRSFPLENFTIIVVEDISTIMNFEDIIEDGNNLKWGRM